MDIELNISVSPFMKPKTKWKYVNAASNHIASIIKSIPKSIESRLSRNYFSIIIFQDKNKVDEKTSKVEGIKLNWNSNIKWKSNEQKMYKISRERKI